MGGLLLSCTSRSDTFDVEVKLIIWKPKNFGFTFLVLNITLVYRKYLLHSGIGGPANEHRRIAGAALAVPPVVFTNTISSSLCFCIELNARRDVYGSSDLGPFAT